MPRRSTQDVRRGAFFLATSLPYFALGSIFLAVVDPGVGTERRGLAIEAGPWTLIGPDNGLLAWALRFLARDGYMKLDASDDRLKLESGGRAVQLLERRFWGPTVSSTFHGRDIFGPVAAELSLGRSMDELGPTVEDIVDLPWPEPRRAVDGSMSGEVLLADGYGNLITTLRPAELPPEPTFEVNERLLHGVAPHFQSNAELIALVGSSGFLEIAAPNGSAAELLRAGPGTHVRVYSDTAHFSSRLS